jgi:ornithine cyclodeaminase/alanine dehydrogenase-like protein (mu-crystallin family)
VLSDDSNSSIEMRQRDGFLLSTPHLGLLEWMPAVRHGATICVKMVGYYPLNRSKSQLPTIISTMCAFDPDTGHLRTIMDGTFTTAIRTGAASALASRILADPGSSVIGLVGCGVQAVTQLHALSREYTFSEIMICDRDVNAEQSFTARSRISDERIRVAPLEEVEQKADILCTATSVYPGDGPVIRGDNLKPAVHINAIGSDMPGKVELPLELLRMATVCPDDVDQARAEGECQQLASDEIGPSLSCLLRDPASHRALRSVQTVYDSTGLPVQDLVMIEIFEEFARQIGVGQEVVIEANSEDTQDPYSFLPAELTWT